MGTFCVLACARALPGSLSSLTALLGIHLPWQRKAKGCFWSIPERHPTFKPNEYPLLGMVTLDCPRRSAPRKEGTLTKLERKPDFIRRAEGRVQGLPVHQCILPWHPFLGGELPGTLPGRVDVSHCEAASCWVTLCSSPWGLRSLTGLWDSRFCFQFQLQLEPWREELPLEHGCALFLTPLAHAALPTAQCKNISDSGHKPGVSQLACPLRLPGELRQLRMPGSQRPEVMP